MQAYRLFSFGSDFKPPAPPPARRHPRGARAAAEEGAAEEAATAEEEPPPAWEPLQVMADRPGGGGQPVEEALGSIMRVLAEAGAAAESRRTEMPSLAAAHAAAYRFKSLITGPGRLSGSREERPRRVNAEERLPWCSGACPRVADSTILERLGAEIKEMGEGYHFITARVDGGALPADTVRPGRKCAASASAPPPPRPRPAPALPPNRPRAAPRVRLRLILATALDDPNPNDEEWEGEMLSFARCDTTVYSIPPGGESEFMPECYKPLYGAGSVVSDERIL